MKFGCAICIFLNSEKLIFVEVQISRNISEGPFNFKITRVDCTCKVKPVCSKCLKDQRKNQKLTLNPIARRKAKIVCNFGLPECNCVKEKESSAAYRFDAPTGFLETLKMTRFTVGFQTLYHTKWCEFAKT